MIVYLCNFCGKTNEDVEALVKANDELAICSECIDECAQIIARYRADKQTAGDGNPHPTTTKGS